MAQQLTAEKREELFQQWSQKQSVALVARVCGICENTVRRYRKLDGWDTRLSKVVTRAAVKADTQDVSDRARHAVTGRAMQKSCMGWLFDNTGNLTAEAKLSMTARDAIRGIAVGVQMELHALGDNAGTDDKKPIVIVVQDQRGAVQSLSMVPLVTDADFEGEDSE